jgi:hypothetical protein
MRPMLTCTSVVPPSVDCRCARAVFAAASSGRVMNAGGATKSSAVGTRAGGVDTGLAATTGSASGCIVGAAISRSAGSRIAWAESIASVASCCRRGSRRGGVQWTMSGSHRAVGSPVSGGAATEATGAATGSGPIRSLAGTSDIAGKAAYGSRATDRTDALRPSACAERLRKKPVMPSPCPDRPSDAAR